MSYIRSTTNPEGLYIYEDATTKRIELSTTLPRPWASTSRFSIPTKSFHYVALRFEGDGTFVSCAERKPTVTVREIHVERGSGNLVRPGTLFLNLRKMVETSFLIELRCGRNYVRMWPVTWHYIAENVRRRFSLQERVAKTLVS